MANLKIAPFFKDLKLAWALRSVWREGYSSKFFWSDVQAGLVVGVVALPLAMALAIASGVAPQQGLYTLIIGGAIVALLGGSRFQVTGPTAAFVVLLLPVVQKFGLSGLLVAGFLSGVMCLAYGLLRLGDVIQYVPHPVTTGFTSGIALVIAAIQVKDFFGLSIAQPSADFVERLSQIAHALPTVQANEIITACATLAMIIVFAKRVKAVPAPILALTLITLASLAWGWVWPNLSVASISTRFSYLLNGISHPGVPQGFPVFQWPWHSMDPNTPAFALNWLNIKEILPSAFAISLLGSIESLLSAVVADGMTGKKHNPNSELVALGVGNMICPFFGGIPAAGAIARTTTNIRFGAVSPLAAFTHAIFVLIVTLLLAPYIGYIPMAALAALLVFVAWNMSERQHFANILKNGSLDDRLVLLTCFGLTVLFDMTVGVGVGIILSSTLFIRRMALLTQGDVVQKRVSLDDETHIQVKDHVFYYRIQGSLFFGAAQKAMDRMSNLAPHYKSAIIDLDDVQFVDMTGLIALDSAVKRLQAMGLKVAVIAPHPQVRAELLKLSSFTLGNTVYLVHSRPAAIRWADIQDVKA